MNTNPRQICIFDKNYKLFYCSLQLSHYKANYILCIEIQHMTIYSSRTYTFYIWKNENVFLLTSFDICQKSFSVFNGDHQPILLNCGEITAGLLSKLQDQQAQVPFTLSKAIYRGENQIWIQRFSNQTQIQRS